MKLRTKLLLNFTILFFVLINIFGIILIKLMYTTSLNNAITQNFNEYNVMYANLKAGESMDQRFFSTKDIIALKNKTYLNNSGSNTNGIEVRDMENKVVYTSLKPDFTLEQQLYHFANDEEANYMISKQKDKHYLIINKKIVFRGTNYYLIYTNNIENIYAEQIRYLIILVVFDLLGGIVFGITIYYLTRSITWPLHQLIVNIERIIEQKNDKNLAYESDIVELKTLTDKFNIMNQEIFLQMDSLKKNNQQKQRFIDSLTHEIRTPLTSIIGYSSLFLERFDDPLITKAFKNIHQNGKRIERLTENLVKLITLDKRTLELEKVELKELNLALKANYAKKIQQINASYEVLGVRTTVITDRYLLEMLLGNFIDNAFKAITHQKERLIEIEILPNGLEIRDTGRGMAVTELEKIFEPFYMVDKSRERSMEGFGLGLAINQSIIEILQIKFSIQSELNIGTKITLSFDGNEIDENE